MGKNRKTVKKSAQDVQDEFFKNMSADKKINVGSKLWELARSIAGDKIYHGTNRSKTTISQSGSNS